MRIYNRYLALIRSVNVPRMIHHLQTVRGCALRDQAEHLTAFQARIPPREDGLE